MLLGAVIGGAIMLLFRNVPVADPAGLPAAGHASLAAAYWAYWCMLGAVVALEFSVLFWAPTFLERVVGLSAAAAAAGAAAFSVAMLTGRLAAGALVRRVAAWQLFLAALLVAILGFLLYWGVRWPLVAVVGLFVLGLGIAPLYPLTVGFAIKAAGLRTDAASARFMLAVGLSILSMPALLGGLADDVGLGMAHLMVPGLVTVALACLGLAKALQRRSIVGVGQAEVPD